MTKCFLELSDSTHGLELSGAEPDGTEEGTVLVKDIRPVRQALPRVCQSVTSFPDNFTNVDGTLFFAGQQNGINGEELMEKRWNTRSRNGNW